MSLLRIVDWDQHYENNRTRELKSLGWVPIPNKMDGDGYTELVDGEEGAAIYGCWIVCVLVASKCDPRGTLLRGIKKPHTSQSLARISRLPASAFETMIERALSIGWLEVCDNPAVECDNPASGCGKAPIEGKGIEGKGREGNGMEKKVKTPSLSSEEIEKQILESLAGCGDSLIETSREWAQYKAEQRKPFKSRISLKQCLGLIRNKSASYGETKVIAAMQRAMASGYQGWDYLDQQEDQSESAVNTRERIAKRRERDRMNNAENSRQEAERERDAAANETRRALDQLLSNENMPEFRKP